MSTSMFCSLLGRMSLSSSVLRSVAVGAPSAIPFFNSPASIASQWHQSRSIHVTNAQQAKPVAAGKGGNAPKKRGKGKGKIEGPDPRIINLKESMPRRVPAPLRFARNRALRHWTIHRAWLLYQRKERIKQERELERMYRSMHNACEELRLTSGPGLRDEGYLYRKAMEKHGMYGHNAIPIEYARPQTETPARQAWNHEWTR